MKLNKSFLYKSIGLLASLITIYVFVEARFPEYSIQNLLNIGKSQFYEDDLTLTAKDEVGPFGKMALSSKGKAFYFGQLQTIDKKRTKHFDITFYSDISSSKIYGGIPVGKYLFSIDDEDLKRYYVEVLIMEGEVVSIELPSLEVYY